MLVLILATALLWWLSVTISFWLGICIGLAYANMSYYDRSEYTGHREWTGFRSLWMWTWLRKYFAFTVDYEDIDSILPGKTYIYAIHPHGVLGFSHILGFAVHGGTPVHPHGPLRPMGHKALFWVPFFRELILWAGAVDVTESNYKRFLADGISLSVVPGGLREMLMCSTNKTELYTGHQGFLRMAMEHQVDVIPVFVHNENKIMRPVPWVFPRIRRFFLRKIEEHEKAQKLNTVRTALICGLGLLTWIASVGPFPENLTLSVGKPIAVDKNKDTLAHLHRRFYDALERLRQCTH